MRVERVGSPSGRTPHQRITLDDGTALRVRVEDVAALGITPGANLDEAAWAALRERAQATAALASAARLLLIRLRSRREIVNRLTRKGYPAGIVSATVIRLESDGLLDDVRFAKAWIAGRLAVRPSGAVRLRRELQQKGVPRDIIEETLRAGLSEADERAQAVALAQARLRRYRREPRDVAARRLAGVLQRRGFSSNAIVSALREVFGRSLSVVE
ncbi:MAG TPA: regulatory protein RecX [bacterium]